MTEDTRARARALAETWRSEAKQLRGDDIGDDKARAAYATLCCLLACADELDALLNDADAIEQPLRDQNERLKGEIYEAAEACPMSRRQHLLDAPLLRIVNEQVSHTFWQQSRAEQAEARVQQLEQERDAYKGELTEIINDYARHNANLQARVQQLEEALKKLRSEVAGIIGYAENDIRAAIGLTNIKVLKLRVSEAEAVLASAGEATK